MDPDPFAGGTGRDPCLVRFLGSVKVSVLFREAGWRWLLEDGIMSSLLAHVQVVRLA